MCVIVVIDIVISRKEVPSAVAGPFGAPVSFHGCEGSVELLFVMGVVRVAVSVGEGPEDDGDGPDDVAMLCVYCTWLGMRAAECVVGRGVEDAECAAGEVNASGQTVEGVVESCGRPDIRFWLGVSLAEVISRSGRGR